MKHLYIVRHGESEMNVQNLRAGTSDTPLTEKGREQARAAGQEAKSLHIDYIISSPQSRAHHTAEEIAREIGYPLDKIELSDLLVERDFGSLEAQPYHPDQNIEEVPDAEMYETLRHRLELAWKHIQTIPADNILVVVHGSSGRMLRTVVSPHIPFDSDEPEHHLPNAHIVQLV